MDICTKFHGNPSNSFQDLSLKIKNVNLLEVLEEKLTKDSRLHTLGPRMAVQNVIPIHPIVVKIFQSGGLTNQEFKSELCIK